MENILAVVLARGGSKRIPDKNLLKLGERNLTQIAVDDAQLSKLVSCICVSTDDERIANSVKDIAKVVIRPSEISGDHNTIEQAIKHALVDMESREKIKFEYVVSLQAAIPLRPKNGIDDLLMTIMQEGTNGGFSVVKRTNWIWDLQGKDLHCSWNPTKYPRSQDLTNIRYEEVNSIQITTRENVLALKRWSSPVSLLVMPEYCGFDIDYLEQYEALKNLYPAIRSSIEYNTKENEVVVIARVPALELLSRRFVGPCKSNILNEDHIGFILGNGPQIDEVDSRVYEVLKKNHNFISIGVNNICCSKKLNSIGFFPNLHLIWDDPEINDPIARQRAVYLNQLQGLTWKLSVDTPNAWMYWPDQRIKAYNLSEQKDIEVDGVHLRNNVCDAAAELLYRMGIRKIYLLGVELNDSRHCLTVGELHKDGIWNQECCQEAALSAWKSIELYHDIIIRSCCKRSLLVKRGIVKYEVPEEFGTLKMED